RPAFSTWYPHTGGSCRASPPSRLSDDICSDQPGLTAFIGMPMKKNGLRRWNTPKKPAISCVDEEVYVS
ncbi:MAG TPA: hypothetical protein VGP12_06795, partial [Nitrosospira sp.]|nr:hypothetical protein [Nitrosospira sp.]